MGRLYGDLSALPRPRKVALITLTYVKECMDFFYYKV